MVVVVVKEEEIVVVIKELPYDFENLASAASRRQMDLWEGELARSLLAE